MFTDEPREYDEEEFRHHDYSLNPNPIPNEVGEDSGREDPDTPSYILTNSHDGSVLGADRLDDLKHRVFCLGETGGDFQIDESTNST